jgi:ethanolamine-phosphate cytidylyltransferase
MIASLHIHTVARPCPEGNVFTEEEERDEQFALPKSLGIVTTVPIAHKITAQDFVNRIQQQQERYAKRFVKKMEAEKDFYKQKYSL